MRLNDLRLKNLLHKDPAKCTCTYELFSEFGVISSRKVNSFSKQEVLVEFWAKYLNRNSSSEVTEMLSLVKW